jgi:hypothetical protein
MNNPLETTPEPETGPSGNFEARAPLPRDAWRRKPDYHEDSRFKSPMLATLLSLVPGLGQVYVGYYQQGFINVLVVGSMITLLNVQTEGIQRLEPLLGFFLAFYWLYNLVDAHRRATYYNLALAGVAAMELPQEFRMPERHGSLPGGLLLIVGGMVIASHTVFGYSLAWLERWWPAALIMMGLYLVVQALLERKKEA